MGGYMQPQGQVQVVTGTVDYGLNPQAVLDAPRWQVTGGLGVSLELGHPEHLLRGLKARGHQVQLSYERGDFGRGQIIWRLEDGVYVAGSDMRADGAAVGW
jgi:gamma-glutamyltranspeptidase/glutathione hydrolase